MAVGKDKEDTRTNVNKVNQMKGIQTSLVLPFMEQFILFRDGSQASLSRGFTIMCELSLMVLLTIHYIR